MKLKRRLVKLALSATLFYYLDPQQGRARRRQLRTKVETWLNRRSNKPIVIADHNGRIVSSVDTPRESKLTVPAAG